MKRPTPLLLSVFLSTVGCSTSHWAGIDTSVIAPSQATQETCPVGYEAPLADTLGVIVSAAATAGISYAAINDTRIGGYSVSESQGLLGTAAVIGLVSTLVYFNSAGTGYRDSNRCADLQAEGKILQDQERLRNQQEQASIQQEQYNAIEQARLESLHRSDENIQRDFDRAKEDDRRRSEAQRIEAEQRQRDEEIRRDRILLEETERKEQAKKDEAQRKIEEAQNVKRHECETYIRDNCRTEPITKCVDHEVRVIVHGEPIKENQPICRESGSKLICNGTPPNNYCGAH